jgi:hypothetical protein
MTAEAQKKRDEASARYFAEQEVAEKRMEAISRRMFWSQFGIGHHAAEFLADALPLTPEQLAKASEVYTPNTPLRDQGLEIGRRLCQERGIEFPTF